jgi:hypothetical protein
MLVIVVFITLLIALWSFIWIYFKQRREIDILKKQLKARPKSKGDGLDPDVKALAKELGVSYQRAEEIYKRAKIL